MLLLGAFILTWAAAVSAQGSGLSPAEEPSEPGVIWSFTITTAEDLMDSLLRAQEKQSLADQENFRQSSQQAFQLYQTVLDHYLRELLRIQMSRQMRQSWWQEFGRQQERFWRLWQSRFDVVLQRDLEKLWEHPRIRLLEKTFPCSGVSQVSVHHEFGSLDLRGSAVGDARMRAEISVVAFDPQEGQQYAQAIDILALTQDSTLHVTTVYPDQRPASLEGASISIRLELPRDCFLEIENAFGDVKAENFISGLTSHTRYGAVEILDCSGDLELINRHGMVQVSGGRGTLLVENSFDPILVSQFEGDVFAVNQFGDVTIRQAAGAVQVENSAGAVEAFDIGGNVTVHNHLGQVLVQKVQGDLMLDNADSRVVIADVLGETHIENRRGEIRAQELGGDVIISNQEGDIDLALDVIRNRLYRLDSAFGVVRLNLPASPSALISAQSLYGTIDSDFPLEITRSGPVQTARGKLGQGMATIYLDGQHSNIYLISSGR